MSVDRITAARNNGMTKAEDTGLTGITTVLRMGIVRAVRALTITTARVDTTAVRLTVITGVDMVITARVGITTIVRHTIMTVHRIITTALRITTTVRHTGMIARLMEMTAHRTGITVLLMEIIARHTGTREVEVITVRPVRIMTVGPSLIPRHRKMIPRLGMD